MELMALLKVTTCTFSFCIAWADSVFMLASEQIYIVLYYHASDVSDLLIFPGKQWIRLWLNTNAQELQSSL